jgi:hypothetical protein
VAAETGPAGFGRLFPQSERSRLYLPAVALSHIATAESVMQSASNQFSAVFSEIRE